MSEHFGEAVKRLAAYSAQALGWRPADFWNATPAELALAASDPAADTIGMTRDHLTLLLERESDG